VKHCTQCGHTLGLGRFCTNCGHPVAARHADPLSDPITDPITDVAEATPETEAWRTDTAERTRRAPQDARRVAAPPLVPKVPPVAVEPPPPPRFPLFADEVAEPAAQAAATVVPAPEARPAWAPDETEDADDWDGADPDEDWEDWEEGRRPRAAWVVTAVAVLVVLVVGAWFLGQALGGDDDPGGDSGAGDPSTSGGSGQEPVDHTAEASARAPRTAPSTQDVDGNATSYDASNMLDGVPETAWRAAGDGSSLKLVFRFPEKTRISEVGLVNGYAKTATDPEGQTFDWYLGHRRITQVTWNFGVGDLVRQDLEEKPEMQTIEVRPVEVRKIVLKIVSTTAPGEGPARRDFTAVSDVLLAG